MLVDITVQPYGVYSVLDGNRGRVFTYDNNGNLLYEFGYWGTDQGQLASPVAIDCLDKTMLVLDSQRRGIVVFEPTDYALLIWAALDAYERGDYYLAERIWGQLLVLNSNFDVAYTGIGRALLRRGEYAEAMKNFKLGNNRAEYSEAFEPVSYTHLNGGAVTRLGDDGRVYYALDEPQAINALRKLGEWENVLGISYGDWQMREFITGRAAIGIMPMWQIDPSEYEFRHGVLPLPMGDDVDDYVFSPGVADAIFIPRNAAYPLGMIALDNFLFPLEDYYETMEDYIRARAFDRCV